EARIKAHLTPNDIGLRIRQDVERGYLSLESDSMMLPPSVEQAARHAAANVGGTASSMLTYLANEIAIEKEQDESRGGRSIPYSTITALDTTLVGKAPLTCVGNLPCPVPAPGEILLNEWAAERLGATVGDRISVSYYVTGAFGELETRRHKFDLTAVVRMDDSAADPGFTPEYEGVTDTRNLADWDPPFPMNLDLVQDEDEDYWDRYKATPKAFISLTDGQQLWTQGHERFGVATSVRLTWPEDRSPTEWQGAFIDALLSEIDPAQVGLVVDPVRRRLVESSVGSTDFSMLFVSFSFFLIASACMLIALLFRLGVDQRSKEIGILLATGFEPKTVRRLLLVEGSIIAAIGCAAGLIVAGGYAWLMLAGLRTWWSAAANAPFLRLHTPPATFAIGYASAFLVAMASVAWSIRGMTGLPAGLLLSGSPHSPSQIAPPSGHVRVRAVAIVSALAAAILLVMAMTDQMPQTAAFFGGGAAFMVACLAAVYLFAVRIPKTSSSAATRPTIARLGLRNAMRNPRRSLLTVALIASATFLITALEAFRMGADGGGIGRESPTGGFALYAESAVSLPFDINSASGRESLGFSEPTAEIYSRFSAIPFRLRPGDESSCLNLYTPKTHRILGATDAMIQRGGFVFASTIEASAEERENPWLLLKRSLPDDVIPVIGDANAVQWQLHSGLGKDLVIDDEHGGQQRLRFVALLSGSVLQDEIIVAESAFVGLFPSISGYAFHLLEVDAGAATEVGRTLERELERFSFDVSSTQDRLAAYLAVQNTYLSTFQTLGGLGLVLGTIGLAVVLLRNVWERRGELALMRALGFSRSALGWLVLSENIGLVMFGLLTGVFSALVAIAPQVLKQPQHLPWMSLGATVALVLIVGIGGGAVALIPTLRTPLLPALRRE
ncbi:MAG: ABC transporter permease, partial [Planctomycetes bacterium]|nr:ABC transporter permease [Planctomycetota bacterium]